MQLSGDRGQDPTPSQRRGSCLQSGSPRPPPWPLRNCFHVCQELRARGDFSPNNRRPGPAPCQPAHDGATRATGSSLSSSTPKRDTTTPKGASRGGTGTWYGSPPLIQPAPSRHFPLEQRMWFMAEHQRDRARRPNTLGTTLKGVHGPAALPPPAFSTHIHPTQPIPAHEPGHKIPTHCPQHLLLLFLPMASGQAGACRGQAAPLCAGKPWPRLFPASLLEGRRHEVGRRGGAGLNLSYK